MTTCCKPPDVFCVPWTCLSSGCAMEQCFHISKKQHHDFLPLLAPSWGPCNENRSVPLKQMSFLALWLRLVEGFEQAVATSFCGAQRYFVCLGWNTHRRCDFWHSDQEKLLKWSFLIKMTILIKNYYFYHFKWSFLKLKLLILLTNSPLKIEQYKHLHCGMSFSMATTVTAPDWSLADGYVGCIARVLC